MPQSHPVQGKSPLRTVHLDDKYTLDEGQVFITGLQALVRLPLMQKRLDVSRGLNTAGFISGYRGSPLGGFDKALWSAGRYLKDHSIHFQPGVNEDLGATAVWGSQQLHLSPGAKVQGVFSLWYGKGPGVDRTGDVFKHANFAGSSTHGGVLALAGDDHACKSSTLPHQSEYAFMDAFIPTIHPATVQDVLDLGLYGWALSRYSGLWVGFKILSDTADTAASVRVGLDPHKILLPTDFVIPEGGLNLRWPDAPLEQERRMHEYKLKAAEAFIRANGLNRVVHQSPKARIGLISVGKGYLDLCQALEDLGLASTLDSLGISLYKVTVSWPLEPQGLLEFCSGLEEIIVVEEKRPLIENQLKEILYHLTDQKRPRIFGKSSGDGESILHMRSELSAREIAYALSKRFLDREGFDRFKGTFQEVIASFASSSQTQEHLQRLPYYCSGCPHNTSTTQLPEGSRAMAGIGCHYMATWIDSHTTTFTQMGGEGVPWIGISPFTEESHIFSNLGDGTYYHSGLLAIRASVAAKVNITYKILYNDAVAMTGGQHVDGPLTVADITQQLYAERIRRIAVVTDEPHKYPDDYPFAPGVTIHHRDHLNKVQEDLKGTPGTTALIYDQTCAAEKRRRRKRGLLEDPNRRLFIHEGVCEGCGDCGQKSNCLSVVPQETEWGRKRAIDQSSCNKDYSCVNGFCPSFVSVVGGKIRKMKPVSADKNPFDEIPEPVLPLIGSQPFDVFITGVGGTGVTTVGALLAMAAHLEGKGCSLVDMTGLAQKGGAVVGHLRLATQPEDIHATRISAEGGDLILGFDLVVTAGREALSKIKTGTTRVVLNNHGTITGHFTKNPDYVFPSTQMLEEIQKKAGVGFVDALDAQALATNLMGDSIMTNLFLVGYAFQKGCLPLGLDSLMEAVRLNGVSVEENIKAIQWGRLAAWNPEAVESFAQREHPVESDHVISESAAEMIERRIEFLKSYQSARYARRYKEKMDEVRLKELVLKTDALTRVIAQSLYRLMAYKDEYEVARLYSHPDFKRRLEDQFEGDYQVHFHLAPPLFSQKNDRGELIKKTYGPGMMSLFKILSRFKFLRGTPLDLFGYTSERRMERRLIKEYVRMIDRILETVKPENLSQMLQIAELPQKIRGFGHVKKANYDKVKVQMDAFMVG